MEDCWRGALPMERHGIPWKVLEGTGSFWTHVIKVCAWMTELLYASCLLSHLIAVSLPFVDIWIYSSLLIVAYSLLTDRLLSMTHYAYHMIVGVLISHSIVAGSFPAWLLVFYCRSTRAYSRAPFLVLSSVAYLSSLEWTLFYIIGTIIQLLVCLIVHIIDLCN